MIAFIDGIVTEIEENRVILEHSGIGFSLYTTSTVTDRLSYGEQIRLYTYMNVKEDDISLFGFLTRDDLKTYKLLLNVNGIGPKAALSVLSSLSADELRFAVLADDAAAIAKTPGIGKKTAQKLILELKDKFSLEEAFEQKISHKAAQELSPKDSNAADEAVQALAALGYSAADALRSVRQIDQTQDMTVEQILKEALKHM